MLRSYRWSSRARRAPRRPRARRKLRKAPAIRSCDWVARSSARCAAADSSSSLGRAHPSHSVDPPRPRVVQRWLPLGGGPTHMGEGQSKAPTGTRPEILVVEDDREINELVCAYAQIAGYGSRSALNGTEAIEQVRRRHPAL